MRKYYLRLGWRGGVNNSCCSNSKKKSKILILEAQIYYPQVTYPRITVVQARRAKVNVQRRETQL